MSSSGGRLVAPDGGWGWMIVVAYAVCNIVIAPTIGSFGLIFKDRYVALGLSATEVSMITNVNAAFGMSMGLVNGPLLRRFGSRAVGVSAGVLMAGGIGLTAGAQSMSAFIVCYSLIAAAGLGMALGAFSLSLNQYFKRRRNRAIGIGMTLTGLGPIFYPPLIAVLLNAYGTGGCVLILAAICTHVVAAALLLQPVDWHLRAPMDVELADVSAAAVHSAQLSRSSTAPKLISVDHHIDSQSIYGVDHLSIVPPTRSQVVPTYQQKAGVSLATRRDAGVTVPQFERSISHVLQRRTSHDPAATPAARKPFLRWFESGSVGSVHLASSVDVFGDADGRSTVTRSPRPSINRRAEQHRSMASLLASPAPIVPSLTMQHPDTEAEIATSNTTESVGCTGWLVNFFDLQLFADPVYVNIMLGMSLAIFAELNFSILTPFVLHDLGYTTAEIATFLSALAGADIVARFAAPFIGDRMGGGARTMYMASLVMLIAARMAILNVATFEGMLTVCIALGVAKGFRTVYMQLVIPAHVPIDRLAAAAGLQMVVNGVVIMALGPIVGVIRDFTGSYAGCIVFINTVTLVTLSMWSVEFVCAWLRSRRTRSSNVAATAGGQNDDTGGAMVVLAS